MLSYTDWLNEDFTIRIEDRSFEQIKEQLLLFCIDPTSIFKRDTNNLDLYTKINKTKTLDELTPYLAWIKRGDYVQALTNWFKLFTTEEKKIKFKQDYGVIFDTLERYKQVRNNFRSMPNPETGELKDYSIYKDILQFKNLDEFYDVMSIFEKEQTNAEKLREIKEDVLVVYYTDDLKILVPLTEEASKIYGKGTKWCTSANINNRFTDYAQQGPLFIIIRNTKRYQFHIESKSYMDELDISIDMKKQKFAMELDFIEEWREDNLDKYFNIIEFSKKNIVLTKNNSIYTKYLKFNKNIESITCNYLDQKLIYILDKLTCDINISLTTENEYKNLNNTRQYNIIFNDMYKYYFKDDFQCDIEGLLKLYYKINGTYKIIDNKIYVQGSLFLKRQCVTLPKIIIQEVSGDFVCTHNILESLDNSPLKVGGNYLCFNNKFKFNKPSTVYIKGYFLNAVLDSDYDELD